MKKYSFIIWGAALALPINRLLAAADDEVTILGKKIDTSSLDGFISLAFAISQWILGITGSVALLAFVVGGTMMLFSGGNQEWVKKGQNTIKGAIIGIVLVFTSYIIIRFVIMSIGGNVGEGLKITI